MNEGFSQTIPRNCCDRRRGELQPCFWSPHIIGGSNTTSRTSGGQQFHRSAGRVTSIGRGFRPGPIYRGLREEWSISHHGRWDTTNASPREEEGEVCWFFRFVRFYCRRHRKTPDKEQLL